MNHLNIHQRRRLKAIDEPSPHSIDFKLDLGKLQEDIRVADSVHVQRRPVVSEQKRLITININTH